MAENEFVLNPQEFLDWLYKVSDYKDFDIILRATHPARTHVFKFHIGAVKKYLQTTLYRIDPDVLDSYRSFWYHKKIQEWVNA